MNAPLGSMRRLAGNRGVTLTELLMVVAIVVLVAGALVPMMQPAMEGREIREAARELTAFFLGAQATAARTGRPAGVLLEADKNVVGAAFRCYGIEVPEPYAGDIVDATAYVVDNDDGGQPDLGPGESDPRWKVVIPIDSAAAVGILPVQEGDQVQFGFRGPWYTIMGRNYQIAGEQDQSLLTVDKLSEIQLPGPPPVTQPIEWKIDLDPHTVRRNNPIDGKSIDPNRTIKKHQWKTYPASRSFDAPPLLGQPLKFIVRRQPKKVLTRHMSLPDRTAVNLRLSGTGASGRLNGNFHVQILFNADGSVDAVRDGQTIQSRSDVLHLLLSRIDFVSHPTNPYQSLYDGNSLWISVNPRTGRVSSTHVIPRDASLPAPDDQTWARALSDSRQDAINAHHLGGG